MYFRERGRGGEGRGKRRREGGEERGGGGAKGGLLMEELGVCVYTYT